MNFLETKLLELQEERTAKLAELADIDICIKALSGEVSTEPVEVTTPKGQKATVTSIKRERGKKKSQRKHVRKNQVQDAVLTKLQEGEQQKKDLLTLASHNTSVMRALKRLDQLGKIEQFEKDGTRFVRLKDLESVVA